MKIKKSNYLIKKSCHLASVYVTLCIGSYLSTIHPSPHSLTQPPINLTIYPSNHLSIHQHIHLSIHQHIHSLLLIQPHRLLAQAARPHLCSSQGTCHQRYKLQITGVPSQNGQGACRKGSSKFTELFQYDIFDFKFFKIKFFTSISLTLICFNTVHFTSIYLYPISGSILG